MSEKKDIRTLANVEAGDLQGPPLSPRSAKWLKGTLVLGVIVVVVVAWCLR